MNMRERRKGPTQPRLPHHANVRWNKAQLVGVAEDETVPRSAPGSMQCQMLTALIDENELLREQNRMIRDLLQAQELKSSTTGSDVMEPTEL